MQIWLQASGFSHSSMSGTRRGDVKIEWRTAERQKVTVKLHKKMLISPGGPSFEVQIDLHLMGSIWFSNVCSKAPFQLHVNITCCDIFIEYEPSLKAEDTSFLSFTSTSLFVQEFVAGGAVAFVADPSVPADVGAAAIVVLAFVHTCRKRGERTGDRRQETGRAPEEREGKKKWIR